MEGLNLQLFTKLFISDYSNSCLLLQVVIPADKEHKISSLDVHSLAIEQLSGTNLDLSMFTICHPWPSFKRIWHCSGSFSSRYVMLLLPQNSSSQSTQMFPLKSVYIVYTQPGHILTQCPSQLLVSIPLTIPRNSLRPLGVIRVH